MRPSDRASIGRLARRSLLAAALALGAGPAAAQIVLGHHYRPHYWDLPTDFKQPFTFPGQTLLHSSSRDAFDARGRKVDTGIRTDTTFGFTIIPRFFKFNQDSRWAYAASLSTYELRIRSDGARTSGVGSLIPSLTGWTKPTANSTLGFDVLLSTPFSISPRLDSDRWDLYLRGFLDANVGGWNLESVVGYQTSFRQRGLAPEPEDQYHLNLRAGYDFRRAAAGAGSLRITPYASMDHQRERGGNAWVTNLGAGVMFTHPGATTWSLGWSRSVDGKNMPMTDGLLAQIWTPL